METISKPMSTISMLLAEDEQITRDLLVAILSKKYPDVTFYATINGKTGLELFKTHMPDIVITDINMPEMGGVQMAGKMHTIKPDTKFIALTGKSGEIVLDDSVENGFEFDHVIVKPVVFQELFAAVDQCLGEIAQHQSLNTEQR